MLWGIFDLAKPSGRLYRDLAAISSIFLLDVLLDISGHRFAMDRYGLFLLMLLSLVVGYFLTFRWPIKLSLHFLLFTVVFFIYFLLFGLIEPPTFTLKNYLIDFVAGKILGLSFAYSAKAYRKRYPITKLGGNNHV